MVRKGIDWLINEQDIATGDLRGKRPAGNGMYSHGIGALAMVEAYGVTKDTRSAPMPKLPLILLPIHNMKKVGGDTDLMNEVIYLLVDGLSWLS